MRTGKLRLESCVSLRKEEQTSGPMNSNEDVSGKRGKLGEFVIILKWWMNYIRLSFESQKLQCKICARTS